MDADLVCIANFLNPSVKQIILISPKKTILYHEEKISFTCPRVSPSPLNYLMPKKKLHAFRKKQIFQTKIVSYNCRKVTIFLQKQSFGYVCCKKRVFVWTL